MLATLFLAFISAYVGKRLSKRVQEALLFVALFAPLVMGFFFIITK